MRPVLAAVCQRLIVVSNCMPGSAHSHAAWAIWRMRSRALTVLTISPSVTARRCQSASSTTACMNSSVTRTELLAFWYWIEGCRCRRGPCRSRRRARTRALRSSRALHQMNSSMSGWSTSRMTILAARRVLPPDLMVPAEASAPRMKLTGPEAVPPPFRSSCDERMRDRLMPAPEPPLKIVPSSTYQLRIESIVSSTERMKQAVACCGTPGTPMLNHTGELNAAFWVTSRCLSSSLKASASLVVDEVAVLDAPRGDRVDHAVDDLAQRRLALGRAEGAAEVLLGDDVGGVQRPRRRELDAELLEGDRAVLEVGDAGVAPLPGDLVVGVDARRS